MSDDGRNNVDRLTHVRLETPQGLDPDASARASLLSAIAGRTPPYLAADAERAAMESGVSVAIGRA